MKWNKIYRKFCTPAIRFCNENKHENGEWGVHEYEHLSIVEVLIDEMNTVWKWVKSFI